MHFANKILSCKSCATENKEERKRHREIAMLVLELKKLRGETSATPVTLPLERDKSLTRKQWKAIKKAAHIHTHDQIITEVDVQNVRNVLYPSKGTIAAELAHDDSELNDALSLKFKLTIFNEKRLMEKLITPPERAPNCDKEAARCLKDLGATGDGKKPAQELIEKIRKAIRGDIETRYRSDCELRKRRVIYAQWVSKGIIESDDNDYNVSIQWPSYRTNQMNWGTYGCTKDGTTDFAVHQGSVLRDDVFAASTNLPDPAGPLPPRTMPISTATAATVTNKEEKSQMGLVVDTRVGGRVIGKKRPAFRPPSLATPTAEWAAPPSSLPFRTLVISSSALMVTNMVSYANVMAPLGIQVDFADDAANGQKDDKSEEWICVGRKGKPKKK
jgi:hypothetical protein